MKRPFTEKDIVRVSNIIYRTFICVMLLLIYNGTGTLQSKPNQELNKQIKTLENDLFRFQENLRSDTDNIRNLDNSGVDSSWTRFWKNR